MAPRPYAAAGRWRNNDQVLTYAAECHADPDTVWRLVARPDRWSRWAPHLSGARGLGRPEVRTGARGFALLRGGVPVPARITAKQAQRSWTWQVGPVLLCHRVRATPDGCRVATDIEAPLGLERLICVTYGPLVALLMANLARVAAGEARSHRAR